MVDALSFPFSLEKFGRFPLASIPLSEWDQSAEDHLTKEGNKNLWKFIKIGAFVGIGAFGIRGLLKWSGEFAEASKVWGQRWNLSPMMIGMTLGVFGTSLPELMVSIMSAAVAEVTDSDTESLGQSTCLGASVISLGLGLGVGAFYYFRKTGVAIPFSRLFLPFIGTLWGGILLTTYAASDGRIDRSEGLLQVGAFAALAALSLVMNRRFHLLPENSFPLSTIANPGKVMIRSLLKIQAASAAASVAAIGISDTLGIEESVMGSVVTATATGLPDMAFVLSLLHRNPGFAIGNLIGLLQFNLVFIPGLVSMVRPSKVRQSIFEDQGRFLLGLLAVFTCCSLLGRVNRVAGTSFLAIYSLFALNQILAGWQQARNSLHSAPEALPAKKNDP